MRGPPVRPDPRVPSPRSAASGSSDVMPGRAGSISGRDGNGPFIEAILVGWMPPVGPARWPGFVTEPCARPAFDRVTATRRGCPPPEPRRARRRGRGPRVDFGSGARTSAHTAGPAVGFAARCQNGPVSARWWGGRAARTWIAALVVVAITSGCGGPATSTATPTGAPTASARPTPAATSSGPSQAPTGARPPQRRPDGDGAAQHHAIAEPGYRGLLRRARHGRDEP